MPERSSDVIEVHSEKALAFGLGGLVSLAVAALLYTYRGDGYTLGIIVVLALFGLYAVGYAIYWSLQIRKVTSHDVVCPYCSEKNLLTATPDEDFTCVECKRLVPIVNGAVIPVSQVRCNYCNELNFYSEKTILLICEKCDHQIPLATADESAPARQLPKGFAIEEDSRSYELTLVAHGNETEDLIGCLQHMLALNRNQVKQMLTELPVTLLRGITRRKAEMLQAQLTANGGSAEFKPIE